MRLSEADRKMFAGIVRETALTGAADVYRRNSPNDGGGGKQKALPDKAEEALAAQAVPMRRPRQAVHGGKPVTIADWEIYLSHPERLPEQLDVLRGDTIQIGNQQWRVVDTDKGKTNALRLTVEALKKS